MKTKILFFQIILLISLCEANAQKPANGMAMFRDSLDNAFDISNWLASKKGFLIVPSIITEPAVGYGLAGAAIYFHSSYSAKKGPPSMSGVLGAGTQNGTWAAGVFHIGYWNHDRIRYMGALARTYANVGFYGSGFVPGLENQSVNLNLDAWIIAQQAKFRVAETDLFLGARYIYLKTDNTFSMPVDMPEFDSLSFPANLSEATAVVNFDSRDNIFTPTKGFFLETSGTYSDTWMGGEDLYGRLAVTLIGYFPASQKLILGVRHESSYSFGNVPYWARPIVILRGAPKMKYQNKNTTVMEAEINWNVFKRWYLIGFTGIGNAFESFDEFDKGKSVSTVGTGFRYKIARKFGAQMGMDFAKSTDDFAFYFVFGCSWLR